MKAFIVNASASYWSLVTLGTMIVKTTGLVLLLFFNTVGYGQEEKQKIKQQVKSQLKQLKHDLQQKEQSTWIWLKINGYQ